MAGETQQQMIAVEARLTRLDALAIETDQRLIAADSRLDAYSRDHIAALERIEARLVDMSPESAPPKEPPRIEVALRDHPERPVRLTIVTSTFNQERYVTKAIESVLRQRTSFPVQLIVTDDGSTDSTIELVEGHRAEHSELITVVKSNENTGYFANVLRALALANTDYLTLLDSDDYWEDEGYLQRGVDYLEAHPEFVIYSTNTFCDHPDGKRTLFIPEDTPDGQFSFEDYRLGRAVISHTSGTIFRNVLFKDGVPEAFSAMVGTEAAGAFAGDFDRYLIHIAEGRARFENRPTGVYTITGEGDWSGLSRFDQALSEARAKVHQWRYFNYRHPEFFLRAAMNWSKLCLEIMRDTSDGSAPDVRIAPEQLAQLWRVVEECLAHRALWNETA